ncbi:MAG: flagellar hook-length control protein FliK [bacterium]|nr:flagellar hook-length control protein FliK [bacterium]
MVLPSIAIIKAVMPPSGGLIGSARSVDDFASLFRGLLGPVKPTGSSSNVKGSDALAQLESLLGSMLQQPPPALTALFDKVQTALGAPPSVGTHASISSISSRIDMLLSSGTTPAQIKSTVAQALTQAFAELSAAPRGTLDQGLLTRLQSSIASALDAPQPRTSVQAPSTTPTTAKALPSSLGPPGNGPPATQAAALAQRIAQVGTAIVAGADSGETGQQFRNLASTLDPSGRGLPAPQMQTAGEISPTVASSSPSQTAAQTVVQTTARTAVVQTTARTAAVQTTAQTAAVQTAAQTAAQATIQTPRTPPTLQLSQTTGAPVRIDGQLASLISVIALANGENGSRPHGGGSHAQTQSGSSAGAWLGALASAQPSGSSQMQHAPLLAGAAAQQSQPAQTGNPLDRYQVVDQVARALAVNPLDGTTTMRIHLVPDQLGDVSVKLVVGPNGVSASFTAATPAAGVALQQGAPQLARSFADHGLQLQQFSVNVGTDSQGGFAYRQPQSFYTPFKRYSGTGAYDDDDPLAAIPSFGPPTMVRALGYFDELV